MNLRFDFTRAELVKLAEFGVGVDGSDGQHFFTLPVDQEVQSALVEMVQATWNTLQKIESGPKNYEPSEKYADKEYLLLPLEDEIATPMRKLHQARDLPQDASILDNLSNVFCYFTRLIDGENNRITAVRRATQFKGLLKKRLLRLLTDTLKLIEDKMFILDNDFDFLIDGERIHILRPSSFEFAGKLQSAILSATKENIDTIQKRIPFVDFEGLRKYVSKHPRAARYLASIRSHLDEGVIDRNLLLDLCKSTQVGVKVDGDKIIIHSGHEMGFLEVLDRRRYEIRLRHDKSESFRAMSREKIK